jgi:hypothetical protein
VLVRVRAKVPVLSQTTRPIVAPINANGVASFSPGLAEERGLPWDHIPPATQPHRGCGRPDQTVPPAPCPTRPPFVPFVRFMVQPSAAVQPRSAPTTRNSFSRRDAETAEFGIPFITDFHDGLPVTRHGQRYRCRSATSCPKQSSQAILLPCRVFA